MIMLKLLFASSLLVLTHGMEQQLVLEKTYGPGHAKYFPGYGTWTVDKDYRSIPGVPMRLTRGDGCYLLIRDQVWGQSKPGTYFFSEKTDNWYTARDLWNSPTRTGTSGYVWSIWDNTTRSTPNKKVTASSKCKKVSKPREEKLEENDYFGHPPLNGKAVGPAHGPASTPQTGETFKLTSSSPALRGTWFRVLSPPNKFVRKVGSSEYILVKAGGASYFCDGEKKYETGNVITKNNDSTWTHTKNRASHVQATCTEKHFSFEDLPKPSAHSSVKAEPVKSLNPMNPMLATFYGGVPFFGHNDIPSADEVLYYTSFHPFPSVTHYLFAMREKNSVVLKRLQESRGYMTFLSEPLQGKFRNPSVFLKQKEMDKATANGKLIDPYLLKVPVILCNLKL